MLSQSLLSVPEGASLSFTDRTKKAAAAAAGRDMENMLELESSMLDLESLDSRQNSIIHREMSSMSMSVEDNNNDHDHHTHPPQNNNDMRAQVEAIILQVLPEEIEHVDQMLDEFHGRENQLLQQLQRMEEMQQKGGRMDPDDFIIDADDADDSSADDENDENDENENETSHQNEKMGESRAITNNNNNNKSGFDMDQWQEDLDEQLDDFEDTNSTRSNPRSNPQAGGPVGEASSPGGGGGGETSVSSVASSSSSLSLGQLKSPPEQMMGESDLVSEEKKNDPPYTNNYPQHHELPLQHQQQLNAVDEDENDLPPLHPQEELPSLVQMNSMRGLKMSALTMPSNSDLMYDHDDDDDDDDEQQSASSRSTHTNNSKGSSTVASNSPNTIMPTISGRKTVALVKLRVYDPARPTVRIKCMATTHIILPNQDELDEAYARHDEAERTKKDRDQDRDGNKRAAITSRRQLVKRLSIVKEEPDKPPERGNSYYDNDDSNHNNILAKMMNGSRGAANNKKSGNNNNDDNTADETSSYDPWEQGRTELRVGSLVGMHIDHTSGSSYQQQQQMNSSSNSNMSLTSLTSLLKKHPQAVEWKVGNSINVHSIHMMGMDQLSELHYRMENNFGSLRELVLDGLPRNTLRLDEAELILDALGSNKSIKRMSMRFSNVEDDVASLFALALVENTSMTQLLLEGNRMTNVSAKNFYSVLKKNNETLRWLDLTANVRIDEDVQQALDQFMEQRALKRTLTNKAEKAKRAARGLPADSALDEDDDDLGDGQVTVICPPDVDSDEVDSDNDVRLQQQQQPDEENETDEESGIVKPLPGEHFRDYMDRMDAMKEETNLSPEHNRRLRDDSMREAEAFEEFHNSGQFSEAQSANYGYKKHLDQQHFSQDNTPKASLNDSEQEGSTGSSITTRSARTGLDAEAEHNDVITTTSGDRIHKLASTGTNSASNKSVKFAESTKRAPPRKMNSIETQESARRRASYDQSVGTEASLEDDEFLDRVEADENPLNDSQKSFATEASAAVGPNVSNFAQESAASGLTGHSSARNGHSNSLRSSSLRSSNVRSNSLRSNSLRSSNQYPNTQISSASQQSSVAFSEDDYLDDKADERALRARLATDGGAIGAYHIEAAAPARQNRSTGGGAGAGGDRRRGRRPRSAEERAARLAQLEGGGAGAGQAIPPGGPENSGHGGYSDGPLIDADIERADDSFVGLPRRRSKLSLMGLDEEDTGTEKVIITIMALLLVGLLVMIVLFVMN